MRLKRTNEEVQLNVLAKNTMTLSMTEPMRPHVRHVIRIQFGQVTPPMSLVIAENYVSATKPQTFHGHVMHYLHLDVIALQASTIGQQTHSPLWPNYHTASDVASISEVPQ